MTAELWYIYLSVGVVSLLALVGVVTFSLSRSRLETVVFYLVSFAAGTLLGDTFLHLIPETVDAYGFDHRTGVALLSGLVLAFVVEKYLSWHHEHSVRRTSAQPLSYMILFGDAVHNLLDGMIIAASFLTSVPLGVATTAAISFHEIPQEIGDFGVLVYGGFSRPKAIFYNFLTALTAVVGATLVVVLAGHSQWLMRVLLPVAAGNFIYIAGTDLLPELVDETDPSRSVAQLATFLGGIGLMYLLAL